MAGRVRLGAAPTVVDPPGGADCSRALGDVLSARLLDLDLSRHMVHMPGLGWVNLYDALAMLPIFVPVVVTVHAIARLTRALRQTRFANA